MPYPLPSVTITVEPKKVYNSVRWLKLRKFALASKPLCERCQKNGLYVQSCIVHHIVPLSEGGPPYPDLDGLECLCKQCHDEQTAQERRDRFDSENSKRFRQFGPDGFPITP